ncbi:MAG: energy transducer TonB, partial [Krumholzibacteria bacterium]|nr:energy transducer TonB [Candidatus Krumholzibacteria bacterium]
AEHDALAADRSGADSERPRADEEGPFPQVDILQEQLDGAGGVAFSQAPLPEPRAATGSPAEGAEGQDEERREADRADGRGEWALPQERSESGGRTRGERDDERTDEQQQPDLEDWWGGQAPSVLKEGEQTRVGDRGFEFDQKSMGDLGAGVAIDGEFSLNTYQWDYAPWIKHFANQLHRHWVAPYAYRLGVISGVTRLRMVVEKDGRLSLLEVIETDGHQSLHDASQAALKAFAPYAPLPPHFPEENLVIILSLHYPAWRR